MLFIDEDHEHFYYEKRKLSKKDAYSEPLIYLFGLTSETRNNFEQLYDIKRNEINQNGLHKGWQTGSTMKITRLAFNLFNGTVSDNLASNDSTVSPYFAVDEIFCVGFAPYFWQAITLRYPEYCTKRGIVK